MKPVVRFVTYDGIAHETMDSASRHLDMQYSDLITRIAHAIVQLKYGEVAEYIDENLLQFLKLAAIKSDMELVDEDNTWVRDD
jgi:hypothetical protein